MQRATVAVALACLCLTIGLTRTSAQVQLAQQIANPASTLAELFATDPALAGACVDLTPRLRRTAEILLAGLVPSRAH